MANVVLDWSVINSTMIYNITRLPKNSWILFQYELYKKKQNEFRNDDKDFFERYFLAEENKKSRVITPEFD